MAERKPLSKKIRFEVFKRDSFTCQYCGRMAPDVILEVDHINPVANGGENDMMNLVTSCRDCNRGKGKRTIGQNDELKKQQEQLRELNEKREQLEMMISWKNELSKFEDEQLEHFKDSLLAISGITLTSVGDSKVKKWIKEFGLIEILECMEISVEQYLVDDSQSSKEKVFSYIPRIANVRKKQRENPMIAKQNYIKAILKNRRLYINEARLKEMLKHMDSEDDFLHIKELATECRNWSEFTELFEEWLEWRNL